MKVGENDELSFAPNLLTGCKLDLFSVALEPIDLVCGASGAVRKQMSAWEAEGEIPPPPPDRLN